MKVAGSIALVTGANRGLGLAFARALKEMGAAKVYAAGRHPEAVTLDGVVPLKLDVTSDEDAAAAASAATDVNLLVNNAGIGVGADQRPSHRTCGTGHPGRRAACRLHRHGPRPQFRPAEEFARANRADDA
jgi:NAD(P)-dependent dehydrogenase (short-subunit alcohol dehydrogenase family)